MNRRTLIRRSLRFHWRTHLGVVLGAAIGSAALIGALVVGDSVKHTLKYQAILRLPGISVALDSGDRFFTNDLLRRMIKIGAEQATTSPQDGTVAWGNGFTEADSRTGLHLVASVSRVDGTARAQRINLYSLDPLGMELIRSGDRLMPGMQPPPFPSKGVGLNRALAQKLNAQEIGRAHV